MDESMHRMTVAEAAQHLGITSDAVRQRIRRGSIHHGRHQDGKVYVCTCIPTRCIKTGGKTLTETSLYRSLETASSFRSESWSVKTRSYCRWPRVLVS